MNGALGLSFLSGFVALSYEILWVRAYAFLSSGAAPAFGLVLAAYLSGLAAGAAVSRRFCDRAAPSSTLGRFVLLSNLLGYVLVPGISWLVTLYEVTWPSTLPLVAVAGGCLGTLFPLISHLAVPPDGRAGARISYLYLANILGSAAGSLLTGFWLTDLWPLRTISMALGLLGALTGGAVLLIGVRDARSRALRVAAAVGVAGLVVLLRNPLYDGLYERLQHRHDHRPGFRFLHVVENRAGVITVSPDGYFSGGGWHDGSVNTGLESDRNSVVRAYAVAGLHPRPREVLLVGLSTGSWASVLAGNPEVERLTIVEINPGYLQVLPSFPEVAGVLSHPKVRIEIDDVRRWLVRNRDRRFDVIVSNTTMHWRSNVANLLSREFLDLARSRLREGGVLYYGTFDSPSVLKTGLDRFPHALKLYTFLALSDLPLRFDPERWKEVLSRQRRGGAPVVADPARLESIAAGLLDRVEPRERLLEGVAAAREITDDNMGTEWTEWTVRR